MAMIGIDLGTTHSLVVAWTEHGPTIIPNALGSHLTPSVVSVDEQGQILIGEVAKERLITHPHLTASVFKRYMGTAKTFQLGSHQFLPEELSSLVIRSLKQDAEAYLGEEVTEAVISVPAYFNDIQRKATQRAGELAGLKVERLLNEPTAAAIAYGLHEQKPETQFLIFDMGGGTFDVSILELFDQVMEVKSVAGDNFLGGEDFTNLLFTEFLQHHQIELESLDKKILSVLHKQAERCKHRLGEERSGTMNYILNGRSLEWTVDRNRFEVLAKPLLNRLLKPMERALKDASLSAKDLDAVVLVGGATRMPLIYSFVGKMFGRLPSHHLNPDEVVALGTAIQAAMKERHAAIQDVVLTDVCPYTLGTKVAVETDSGEYESGHFLPIIERNTIIPVSKVERLYTIRDNQTELRVEVYQGESRLTKNNIFLGKLEIPIPAAPAGEQAIDVRYTYDINSLLEVEVTAVETGIKKQLIIQEKPGQMSKEEIEERFQQLENLKIHPRDRLENRLLLARGDRLYEESLAELRMVIATALQRFEQALRSQDDQLIKHEAKRLKEFLDQVER